MPSRRGEEMKSPGVGGRLAEVPIGCVLYWGKGSWGIGSVMPYGYLECNGQTVSDKESPLNGQTLPDMTTGSKKFIRGSTTSGAVAGADTANHTHGSSGQSASQTGASVSIDISGVSVSTSGQSASSGGDFSAVTGASLVGGATGSVDVSAAIIGSTDAAAPSVVPVHIEMVPIMRIK